MALSQEELDRAFNPKRKAPGQKSGLLSFLPAIGGIAGSIIGTPMIGGAAGAGLGALLAQILGGEGLKPGELGKETLLGGVGGGIGKVFGLGRAAAGAAKGLGVGAGEAAGQITGKLAPEAVESGIGRTLRGTFLPSAAAGKATPFSSANRLGLMKTEETLGLTGSNAAKLSKSGDAFSQLETQVKTNLRAVPKVSSLKGRITSDFDESLVNPALGEDLSYLTIDPRTNRIYQAAVTKARERAITAAKSGRVESVYDLKSQLRKELQKALEQTQEGQAVIQADSPVYIQREVNRRLFNSLKTSIDDIAEEAGQVGVKGLNKLEHDLFELAPLYQKGADKPFASVFGVNLPGRPFQAGADLVGRGITGIEEQPLIRAAGRAGVAPAAAGQAGARMLGGGFGAPPEQAPEGAGDEDAKTLFQQYQELQQQQQQQTEQQPEYAMGLTPEKVAEGMLRFPEYASQLEGAYKMLNPTTKVNDRAASLAVGLQAVDDALAGGGGVGYGPFAGRIEQFKAGPLGGLGSSREAIESNSRYQLLRQSVVRAMQGARMSDVDIQLAMQYTPQLTDTPDSANAKLLNLKRLLESNIQFLQTGGGAESDLLSGSTNVGGSTPMTGF